MSELKYKLPHGMTWGSLKKKFELRLHPDLAGRLKIQMTRYRKSHDSYENAIRLEWDKKTIIEMSTLKYRRNFDYKTREEAAENGYFCPEEFRDAMRLSLLVPVKDLLESEDSYERAVGLMDKRCGKRTLEKFNIEQEKMPLVKEIYRLRTEQI